MNKKDCESIGYLLSIARSREDIEQGLFSIDSRIEPEFIAYEEVQGRCEEVDKRASEIMNEAHSDSYFDWSLIKKENLKFTYGEALEKARKEVYGIDYNPSLFK